ncbi:hypothetical protein DL768_010727 [Monosporascus sp. mg162]|nr:hypothetical protein DL768_010727 [Monosporascus sp. mg162]
MLGRNFSSDGAMKRRRLNPPDLSGQGSAIPQDNIFPLPTATCNSTTYMSMATTEGHSSPTLQNLPEACKLTLPVPAVDVVAAHPQAVLMPVALGSFEHSNPECRVSASTDEAAGISTQELRMVQEQVMYSAHHVGNLAHPVDSNPMLSYAHFNRTTPYPPDLGVVGATVDTALRSGLNAPTDLDIHQFPSTSTTQALQNPLGQPGHTSEVIEDQIVGIEASLEGGEWRTITEEFPAQLKSSDHFVTAGNPQISGRIVKEQQVNMLQDLLDEPSITLQLHCNPNVGEDLKLGRGGDRIMRRSCTLSITIFGTMDLFEDIGIFFQEYRMYLQDPRGCDRDVKYCNPHRLSWTDLESTVLVSDLKVQANALPLKEVNQQQDPLELLILDWNLNEAGQPSCVKTTLAKHQKQALTFMLRNEHRPVLDSGKTQIWEAVRSGNDGVFVNRITDTCQAEWPPQFQGGIIADPMGFGKTLTMISLVAMDMDMKQYMTNDVNRHEPTLVIVPPLHPLEEIGLGRSAPISLTNAASEETLASDRPNTGYPGAFHTLPTKVQALISNLKDLNSSIKWSTLDLVEAGLEQASIHCVRIDGNVPQKERHAIIDRFKEDSTIRVMLLTLSCGAVGLTLTAASRAYLMEPHWNPGQEEQALARIHRMGQTQEVTTIRFYIKGCVNGSAANYRTSGF